MRMQRLVRSGSIWLAVAFVMALVCPQVASAGPYIFITLDSPTGDPTQPFGINASRQVSATAEPASLLDQGLIFNVTVHPFESNFSALKSVGKK